MTYQPFVSPFPDDEDGSAAEGRTALAAIIQGIDYMDDPADLRETLKSLLLALSLTTATETDAIACLRAMGRLERRAHYAQLEHWTDAPIPQ